MALTLLVAESEPARKDLIIRLVLNRLAEDRSWDQSPPVLPGARRPFRGEALPSGM